MNREIVRKPPLLLSFSVFVLLSVAVIAAEAGNDHAAAARAAVEPPASSETLVWHLISRLAKPDATTSSLAAERLVVSVVGRADRA